MNKLFSPALNAVLSRVSKETVVDIMKVYAALPSHVEIGGLKFTKSTYKHTAHRPDGTPMPRTIIIYKCGPMSKAQYYISSNAGGHGLSVNLFVGVGGGQPIGSRSLRPEAASNEIVEAMQSIYDTAVANARRGRNA